MYLVGLDPSAHLYIASSLRSGSLICVIEHGNSVVFGNKNSSSEEALIHNEQWNMRMSKRFIHFAFPFGVSLPKLLT